MASLATTGAPTDETTSMRKRAATITPHQLISFSPESGRLIIKVDFMSPGPVPNQDSVDHLLDMINTLPQYAYATRSVSLGIIFKYRNLDDLGFNQARHLVIARIVEEINSFQSLMALRVLILVGRFHWDQILEPLSALYGFKSPYGVPGSPLRTWFIGMKETEVTGQPILAIQQGSPLDRVLHARFLRGY